MKGRNLVIIFISVIVVMYLVVYLTIPDSDETLEVSDGTDLEVVEVTPAPVKTQVAIAQSTPEPEPDPTPVPTPVATPDPNLPAELAALDPNDENQVPLSGQLGDLIDAYGAVEVYKRLYYYNRQEMLDYMFFNLTIRDHAAELLALENELVLRLNLIESLEPNYIPREEEVYDPSKIDTEFIKILEAPVPGKMDQEEWTARMNLASMVSDQAALDFARKAPEMFPDSKEVQVVGAANMLLYESEHASLSPAERSEAREKLASFASDPSWLTDVKNDYRLSGYRAIAGFPDSGQARQILESALEAEPDARLRDRLREILGNL